jgi:uncharacterized protein (DUF1330 family)
MAAYVIAEFGAIEAAYDVARLGKTSRVGKFGEKMLVDSSRFETLTGDWAPKRVVVLAFPTMELAQSWWAARERSAPPQMKQVKRNLILIDGL